VIDITNPTSPTLIATCATYGAYGIAVSGSYAYVADSNHGMRVIDITDPASPALIATCTTSDAHGIAVSGSCAYIADGGHGMRVIDNHRSGLSGPDRRRASPPMPMESRSSGSCAYVADGRGGLQVINISNPALPTLKATCSSSDAMGVAVSGSCAYLADWDSGLRVIDHIQSRFPDTQGNMSHNFCPGSRGQRLLRICCGRGGSGLRVIDITDPASPTSIAACAATNASGVAISGSNAYMRTAARACGSSTYPIRPLQP